MAVASAAQAQTCAGNFTAEGTPLVTAISYKSWQSFPKLDTRKAFDNAARAVAAEGFSNIRSDKPLGAITAMQETSDSGRPQTLRVVVRKAGAATRVDAVFMVQPGQVAPENLTRAALCRVIQSANYRATTFPAASCGTSSDHPLFRQKHRAYTTFRSGATSPTGSLSGPGGRSFHGAGTISGQGARQIDAACPSNWNKGAKVPQ